MEPGDDLAGIRADDALLDALGGRGQTEALVDDELNALLLAWRREVDSRPVGELVDTDTAVATIAAARPQQRRHRFLIPLASAAAVLAIAFTGVSLVARDAQPGDALWGLTRVLYSEHARSVEAAVTVRTDLDTARIALREGRYGDARSLLDRAGQVLPSISVDDGKADLEEKHGNLWRELTSTTPPPASTPAGHSSSSAPLAPTTTSAPSSVTPAPSTTDATTTTQPTPTTTTTPTTNGTVPTSNTQTSGGNESRGEPGGGNTGQVGNNTGNSGNNSNNTAATGGN
ncbi:anti-sigma-D factor RsdA [Saccharothrix obliqua]|uniref:anti-sigma-D factor RsdA n=1 Tax=Saccharothrix obliqua TaxID=2861747 RepID=UPI0027E29C17|nr:anti-sigma-D factor RsdA [Saccharothrix obliqua]